jgi:hypothetical protein
MMKLEGISLKAFLSGAGLPVTMLLAILGGRYVTDWIGPIWGHSLGVLSMVFLF